MTLTGAQLNAILIGSGTINLGAGAGDTINLTSTSTDLNTLGCDQQLHPGRRGDLGFRRRSRRDHQRLSGQTEAFTITGSNQADIITGGTGADTIDAGAGDDTINIANGQFVAGESDPGRRQQRQRHPRPDRADEHATTVDFSTGGVSGVETLTGSAATTR